DSETTIEDIDPELIGQVEVIKGPLSSLHGAGLGGAIIISPKVTPAYHKSRAFISTTHGSYGLMKNAVNYGLNTANASLNIGYNKLEADGWRENSAYNRENITLAGEIFKKEKSRLTYFGSYTYVKAYIHSSIDKATFENNPRAEAPTWKAAQGYEEYESYLGGLAYDWQVSHKLKNSTSVFINVKENYEPRPFDILSQNTTAYGARTQFSGNFSIGNIISEFIVGMEY